MKPLRYDDLPPAMRKQVDRMLTSDRPLKAEDIKPPVKSMSTGPAKRKMTKTEAEFMSRLAAIYGRECVHFEGITLRMANGHRYTPDFVIRHDAGLTLYEVKGGYRLGSYQRARLAFDQARVEWPCWSFVWAEKRDGKWIES